MANQIAPTATMSIMLELRKYLMLMAILAATVTYVAGLNPPGGVWLRTEDGHLTGDQVLLITDRRRYNAFYYSNAMAFMTSVVVILLLLLMERSMGKGSKRLLVVRLLTALRVVMVLDFFAVLVAYAAGASRGTATTVVASVLVSAVSVYITGYAAYRALFRPRPPDPGPGDPQRPSLSLKLERRRKILMLFSIFAATVTYTAGLSPPGGFWPDSREGHRPGSPVMEDQHHSRRFIAFFICNTAAFIASLRGIMLLTTIRSKFKDGDGNGRWWYVLYGHVVVALLGLLVAYTLGSCRETHSTLYVFGLVFPAVLAYTATQFIIQRYWWDELMDLAEQGKGRLSSHWIWLSLRLRSCWSSMCSCWTDADEENTREEEEDGLGTETTTTPVKRAHTAVLLLATLSATITYQAGMNPPGGFWPDSRDGHTGGDPILLTTHAGRYKVFFAFNSLTLVTSVVVIVMVLTRHASSAVHKHHALEAAIILDLLSLMAAYAVGCGRDVNASVRVIALAGGILVCVVVHIVFFTLKTRRRERPELLKKKRKLLLLFAILVVTITYQAGLTPPGGFWLDDEAGHVPGYAALASNYPRRYTTFFYCNAASFMSSVVIILLLVNPHMYELGIMCHALYLCAVSALFGLIGAYAAGSSRRRRTSLFLIALIAGVVAFIVLLLLALKFLSRCTIFLGRQANEQRHPQPEEGGEDSGEPQDQEGGDDSGKEQPEPQTEETEEDVDRETARYTTRKYLMVVSILVASVTYQAGLIPPGGVWPDTSSSSIDGHGHAAGDPVLQDSNKRRYSLFFYSNSVSFLASVVVIFLLQLDEPLYMVARKRKGLLRVVGGATTSHPSKSDEVLRVAQSTILLALVGLLFAYASGCARRWETFGYVVVLIVAVLLYIAIHVLLSCRDEQPAQVTPLDQAQAQAQEGGSSYCTDRQRQCRCNCHEKDERVL